MDTWPTPELQEAINQGYVIQHVYEVWHFTRNSNTMFSSYVDTFLKIKQEASGWPEWVGDDPDKRQQYLDDYQAKEGIALDPDKIDKNPGRRSLAKMMLNSFWGKYGQQGNKSQVESISSSQTKLYELLNDDSRELQTLRVMNDEMIEVVYKRVDEEETVQVNINIFVACFTTCWARLKLYREGLSQLLPQQVLYFDTDSIIFSHRPGQPMLPLGDHLGEFTSELKPDDHIVEFAAAGPKNYGYRTHQGKVECKVRGFTLNARGQDQLNFDLLKANVIDDVTDPPRRSTRHPRVQPPQDQTQCRHQDPHHRGRNQTLPSRLRQTRRRSRHVLSYPYGYEKQATQLDDDLSQAQAAQLDDVDMRNVECLMDL